jgi:NADPH:quinone reductase-like Zn-dependent oxidoreductase
MMDVAPASPSNPKVPGMDFSGTIYSLGSGIDSSRFAVGAQVFGLAMDVTGKGTMQQYLAMKPAPPGDEQASHVFVRKPEGLTHVQAAALPLVYSTIYTGFVHHGHLTYPSNATHNEDAQPTAGGKGKSVLILGGSGGTGTMAIQFAKQIPEVGGRIVTSCSAKNTSFVKTLGAAEVRSLPPSIFLILIILQPGNRLHLSKRRRSSPEQPVRAVRPRLRLCRRSRLYPALGQAACTRRGGPAARDVRHHRRGQ